MNIVPGLPVLVEKFFMQRLIKQRQCSPNTISSYRDTFCLLFRYVQEQLHKPPSCLELSDIDAPLIAAFLDSLEKKRSVSARTRNARLVAIRSFFKYAAFEAPCNSAQIQRVLAIPSQRSVRPLVNYLTREEVDALLAAPNRDTWCGHRDYIFLMVAVQTGLRLSEMTALQIGDLSLETGAHIRVIGKGRKERIVPLTKQAVSLLKNWIRDLAKRPGAAFIFPSSRGGRLSSDAVQYMFKNYVSKAAKVCSSLEQKQVTPHSLRHSSAMALLMAGVDRSLIALWLGHESVETTQMYLHANLALKEEILSKTSFPEGKKHRYRPEDRLLLFLKSL